MSRITLVLALYSLTRPNRRLCSRQRYLSRIPGTRTRSRSHRACTQLIKECVLVHNAPSSLYSTYTTAACVTIFASYERLYFIFASSRLKASTLQFRTSLACNAAPTPDSCRVLSCVLFAVPNTSRNVVDACRECPRSRVCKHAVPCHPGPAGRHRPDSGWCVGVDGGKGGHCNHTHVPPDPSPLTPHPPPHPPTLQRRFGTTRSRRSSTTGSPT